MLAGLLLGVLCVSPCVFIYFLAIKGIDRYEPEPWWLLIGMFLWGALVSTTMAIIASIVGQGALVWATGMGSQDPLMTASSATFIAPLTEETAKVVGLLLLWGLSAFWLKELDGPLDGVIYGGVVGLGFTLTEDILYVAGAMAEGGIEQFTVLFVVRTILSGLGHASFTAVAGLGIGIAVEARHPAIKVFAPLAGWIGAMMLHGIHNGLVTFLAAGGVGLIVKLLLFWMIDLLYFVLLIALVVRDRKIVIRGLQEEVGRLIHQFELLQTTSGWMFVPFWNFFALMSAPGGYLTARRKQLALIELAFLKWRLSRGETGLERKEYDLRTRVQQANQSGVLVGQQARR
jgi:RsiW-degrading membrane proteinase PrsW (M82 family)